MSSFIDFAFVKVILFADINFAKCSHASCFRKTKGAVGLLFFLSRRRCGGGGLCVQNVGAVC